MSPLPPVNALVQAISLSRGLYVFSVKSGASMRIPHLQNLSLPAVHVGVGPGTSEKAINFLVGPRNQNAWLTEPGDVVVAKVSARVTVIITSLQSPQGRTLAIDVSRVDAPTTQATANRATRRDSTVPEEAPFRGDEAPSIPPTGAANNAKLVPVTIKLHIRNQGDMVYTEPDWAGRVGIGKWIEAFAVTPLAELATDEIEYKALTATGLETPWVTKGADCGTRGKSMPLMGFAVRIRANGVHAHYDCEYSGYFASGTIIGPLRNGAPCRSKLKNDPLEGVQIRFAEYDEATRPPTPHEAATGPCLSKLREFDDQVPDNGTGETPLANSVGRETSKKARLLARTGKHRAAEHATVPHREADSGPISELRKPSRPKIAPVVRPANEPSSATRVEVGAPVGTGNDK